MNKYLKTQAGIKTLNYIKKIEYLKWHYARRKFYHDMFIASQELNRFKEAFCTIYHAIAQDEDAAHYVKLDIDDIETYIKTGQCCDLSSRYTLTGIYNDILLYYHNNIKQNYPYPLWSYNRTRYDRRKTFTKKIISLHTQEVEYLHMKCFQYAYSPIDLYDPYIDAALAFKKLLQDEIYLPEPFNNFLNFDECATIEQRNSSGLFPSLDNNFLYFDLGISELINIRNTIEILESHINSPNQYINKNDDAIVRIKFNKSRRDNKSFKRIKLMMLQACQCFVRSICDNDTNLPFAYSKFYGKFGFTVHEYLNIYKQADGIDNIRGDFLRRFLGLFLWDAKNFYGVNTSKCIENILKTIESFPISTNKQKFIQESACNEIQNLTYEKEIELSLRTLVYYLCTIKDSNISAYEENSIYRDYQLADECIKENKICKHKRGNSNN